MPQQHEIHPAGFRSPLERRWARTLKVLAEVQTKAARADRRDALLEEVDEAGRQEPDAGGERSVRKLSDPILIAGLGGFMRRVLALLGESIGHNHNWSREDLEGMATQLFKLH